MLSFGEGRNFMQYLYTLKTCLSWKWYWVYDFNNIYINVTKSIVDNLVTLLILLPPFSNMFQLICIFFKGSLHVTLNLIPPTHINLN